MPYTNPLGKSSSSVELVQVKGTYSQISLSEIYLNDGFTHMRHDDGPEQIREHFKNKILKTTEMSTKRRPI